MAPNQTEDKLLSPCTSDSEASTVTVFPYSTDSSPSPILHTSGSSSTETCSSLNLNLLSPCASEAVTEPGALYHSETSHPLQKLSSGPTPSNV